MSITLRIILVTASIITLLSVVYFIRKAKMKSEDSVFWIFLASVFVLISIFPKIVDFGARLTGVASAVNFLFLAIIFILLYKLFRTSIRLSQLEYRFQQLVQRYGIDMLDSTRSDDDPENSADSTKE